MPVEIKIPDWGPPDYIACLQAIADRIEQIKPVSGSGTLVDETTTGSPINIDIASVISEQAAAATHPFKGIAIAPTEDGGSYQIRALYGTLWGAAPDGMSSGDDPPYIFTPATSSGILYGQVTRDATSGVITGRTLHQGTSLPDDSETEGHIQLFSWSTIDGVIVIGQAVSGSQAGQYCNGWLWGLI